MADEEVKTEEVKETPKVETTVGTGLEPNVAAMLAYLFGWLGGLIFFLIEKDNKFVKFAAMQSILLNVAGIVIYVAIIVLAGVLAALTFGIGALAALLIPVFWIAYLIVWIMVMVKAYQNKEWELPVIGKIARSFIK